MQNININIRGLLTEVVELVAKEYIKPLQERVEMLERQRAMDEIATIEEDTPKKQVHWANDYGYGFQNWWPTREDADDNTRNPRIAVIRREWVEGQLPQYFTEEV
jgi:hypothetical protein